MIVLVDCDGVLSDFHTAVLDLAFQVAGIDKTLEDWTEWDTRTALGWPEADEWITRRVLENEFCYRMNAYPGALSFLRRLEGMVGKENVLICTSPWNAEWMSQRAAWLEDVAEVPVKRQIQCSRKDLVAGLLIDDSSKHLRERDSGFCIARPWNRDYFGHRGGYEECLANVRNSMPRVGPARGQTPEPNNAELDWQQQGGRQ